MDSTKKYKMTKKRNAGNLDKFYTNQGIVNHILKTLNLDEYETIIEPSAGDGSFSSKIEKCIAYDISPESQNIIKADFLELELDTNPSTTLILGNPPFGKQSSLALKFIKKSCLHADTVAFILPKSFKKKSYKDRIPLTHTCIFEEDLPNNAFLVNGEEYAVPTVFQIWKKLELPRIKEPKKTTEDFIFCKKSENPDIAIRRVGWYAGKVFESIDQTVSSFYFIKCKKSKKEIITLLSSISWDNIKNNTVGIKSISKGEIIEKYLEIKNE